MKHKTLEETFETVLYEARVKDSEELAGALMKAYTDWVETVYPSLCKQVLDEIDENEGDSQ